MTHSSRLERRYRSLLALYPKAFRREHEQEILSVLMADAPEDQKPYADGQGGWWGALLVPAATLQLYIVYRLIHRPEQAPEPSRGERL
jgi:hypothetical protein